jgi:PBP1b-binding outer membrane lipoprotein LpoB
MRIVPVVLIGSALFLAGCQAKKGPVEHNDTLTPDQLPVKVRNALKTESDTPVESVNRREFKGKVVYEAVAHTGGRTYDVELDSEGRLLRRSQRPVGQ